MVAGHRQHGPEPAALKLGPQGRVGAGDLVTGQPRRRDVRVQRAADHRLRQGWLGRELDLVGDAGGLAAARIVDPALGQVQLPVDHGVACLAGSTR